MKHTLTPLTALLLAPLAALHAADAPALIEPLNEAVTTMSIPHFQWKDAVVATTEAMPGHVLQIAADKDFGRVVDRDRVAAVIRWYVPDKELAPGEYWWRVANVDGDGKQGAWSAAWRFTVKPPERLFRVSAGADWAAIQRTFAEAASNTPCRVVFDKADYRLDPRDPRQFIRFTSASDLILDGSGAAITFTHPVGLVNLAHCRRVVVKNFTFDFDPPAYTAGRVVAVDAKAGRIEAEILPGHALPDAYPAFSRDPTGMVVTEADGFAMKRGIPLVVTHAGFERIEGWRFRFRFENAKTAGLFAVRDVYVLDPRWQAEGGGHGAVVNGGEDVVFLNLTLRSAANECLGSFYADRHAILHVKLERPPGRALSVNNGGNNHHNARTGPWIEGCLFENCGDDVCHVSGYAMAVAEQPAPDKLVINLRQPFDQFGAEARLDFRTGDRLQFYDRSQGRLLGERQVVSVTPQTKSLLVGLDRAIDGLKTGRLARDRKASGNALADATVTQVFNASRMCNQFVFRHNTARNSRRIGVLAKGDGGLIEHNTFEGLGGGAVEFWNAPFEGLAAENYVVRHNRILDCGRLDREHAAIWATLFKTGGDRLHRNLLIEQNEIQGFPLPALLLRDVQNAVVRGNRIAPAPPIRPGQASAGAIVFTNTSAVRLERNSIKEP